MALPCDPSEPGGGRSAALIGEYYAERNREYPLVAPVFSVGRSRENTPRVSDERLAAEHLRITHENGDYVAEAVSADGQATLNGARLRPGQRRPLSHGDLINVAGLRFRFIQAGSDIPLARIRVTEGMHRGKSFRIDLEEVNLGRAPWNDLQFPDRSVSRRHCRIQRVDDGWRIEDLESLNSTLLNGEPVRGAARLAYGDTVQIGWSRFVFERAEARSSR